MKAPNKSHVKVTWSGPERLAWICFPPERGQYFMFRITSRSIEIVPTLICRTLSSGNSVWCYALPNLALHGRISNQRRLETEQSTLEGQLQSIKHRRWVEDETQRMLWYTRHGTHVQLQAKPRTTFHHATIACADLNLKIGYVNQYIYISETDLYVLSSVM